MSGICLSVGILEHVSSGEETLSGRIPFLDPPNLLDWAFLMRQHLNHCGILFEIC